MQEEKHKLIPSGIKDGKLYTFKPNDNTLDYTVDRASTATRINKEGLIETVGNNIPRIDYSTGEAALLVEEQVTNLELYSIFSTIGYAGYGGGETTLIENATIAPDGSNTATRLDGGAGLGRTSNKSRIITVKKNTSYTYSYYIKDISLSGVYTAIYLKDTATGVTDSFSAPTILNTDISKTEWTRITYTFNTDDSDQIYLIQPTRALHTGESIYVWGYQLEEGSKATSLIPTSGATVTRLADVITSPNYLTELGTRSTKYVEIDGEKKLILNTDGALEEGRTKLLSAYTGLLSQPDITSLNVNRIQYGELDDITTDLATAQSDGSNLLVLPAKASTGSLESLLPEDGSLDITVDRNSTATRVNKDGLIETVPANTPRIDYSTGVPMVLREEQATNLITYSEDFSQWNLFVASITPNIILSPNGTLTADKFIPNVEEGLSAIAKVVTFSSVNYTASVYAKKGENSLFQIVFGGAVSNGAYANFDVQNGIITGGSYIDATIELVNGGWYKCSITFTAYATTGSFYLWHITSGTDSRSASTSGDGTSGLYFWGAQLEEGSEATSYIPTAGTTVTRLADKLTIPDNRLTAYINDKVVINPSELDETTAIIKGYSGLQSQATIDANTPSVIQYGVQSDITKKLQLARKHAEPSLMMLPAKGGVGNLQSILPADGTGDFTVDRNSTASYVAEDGTIKTALANEPRFDWSSGKPALLVEGQATNLINYSLININWGKRASVTPTYNYGVAPDGTLTSTHLTWDNVNYSDAGYVWQSKGITKSSTAYTFSFWGKGSGTVEVWIWNNSPSSIRTTYTLTSEWQRFESTTTTSAGALSSSDYGFQNYTDLEVWGVQLEEASTATSYIPTSGSTVTRLGEQIRSVPEGISNIQGTLFIDFNDYFTAHGAISMGKYKLYRYSGHYEIYDGGWISNKVVSKKGKIAIRYNSEGTSIFINGVDETKVNTPAPTTPFNFDINITRSDNQAMIKSLNHYPTALTDEQLIELTTPYYNSYSEMAEENNYTIQ